MIFKDQQGYNRAWEVDTHLIEGFKVHIRPSASRQEIQGKNVRERGGNQPIGSVPLTPTHEEGQSLFDFNQTQLSSQLAEQLKRMLVRGNDHPVYMSEKRIGGGARQSLGLTNTLGSEYYDINNYFDQFENSLPQQEAPNFRSMSNINMEFSSTRRLASGPKFLPGGQSLYSSYPPKAQDRGFAEPAETNRGISLLSLGQSHQRRPKMQQNRSLAEELADPEIYFRIDERNFQFTEEDKNLRFHAFIRNKEHPQQQQQRWNNPDNYNKYRDSIIAPFPREIRSQNRIWKKEPGVARVLPGKGGVSSMRRMNKRKFSSKNLPSLDSLEGGFYNKPQFRMLKKGPSIYENFDIDEIDLDEEEDCILWKAEM